MVAPRGTVAEVVPAYEAQMVWNLDQTGDRIPEGIPVHAVEGREAKFRCEERV
jgi:hypothetical protein